MEKRSLFISLVIYAAIIILMRFISFNIKTNFSDFINLGFYTDIEGKYETPRIERSQEGKMDVEIPSYGDIPIKIEDEKVGVFDEKTKSFEEEKEGYGNETEKGYSISGEISTRKLIKFKRPEYPKEEKETSMVQLEITVNESGEIIKIDILKTGGYNFDRNAIDAIKEWRFMPVKNVPEQKGIVTINFKIR